MAIRLPPDTAAVLGARADECESRSLYLDRFTDPSARDDKNHTPRKHWFNRLINKRAVPLNRASWLPPNAISVRARLLSRLMVNMAGAVMENAGLCLDRFGLPVIPGSAVKGCARRMALQALEDWSEKAAKAAGEDLSAPACAPFTSRQEMLESIVLVFGWVEQDWSRGSDLAWACGEDHKAVWKETCMRLADKFRWKLPQDKPWKKLPNFAGSVAFLAAHPEVDPGLELDVVTCHHPDYYAEKKDKRGRLVMPAALDTEDPNPVYFPAVRPQPVGRFFSFSLLPLRESDSTLVRCAKIWLANGLEIFGIGAKVNAGYGWFQVAGARTSASDELLGDQVATRSKVEEIINKWSGKLVTGNFRVALPEIAAVEELASLKRIFEAVIPERERQRMKKNQPYWQSFSANPSGNLILERLSLKLS